MFSVHGLTTSYLSAVSVTLAAGECVGVHGPSGAGKTLFLRALADLDPAEGEVVLQGVARAEIPAPEWRRRVGLLPSEPAWWSPRVANHFVDPGGLAVTAVGLPAAILQREVAGLSSGERQRLGLLRMLAMEPQVLLLDEPTANLDLESTQLVEAHVLGYLAGRGACCLWVSHDHEQRRRVARREIEIVAEVAVGSGE